jgi:hypothetical protein
MMARVEGTALAYASPALRPSLFRGPKGGPVEIVIGLFCFSGAQAGMSESHHRSCQCGAVYSRTEAMAPERQIASFECSLCDTTLETWNTAWVPTYQFLAGPVRLPNPGTNPR